MKTQIMLAVAAVALSNPAIAQDEPEGAPSPNQIVDAAPAEEWRQIAAEDLLVMTLAPEAQDNARQVVIQLMPAPFSQGWVENIRTLARAEWYDDITVNRVQDNYVVQWGDPNYDNPEAEGEAKPLPEGLRVINEGEYVAKTPFGLDEPPVLVTPENGPTADAFYTEAYLGPMALAEGEDAYAPTVGIWKGWPFAYQKSGGETGWPVHCYGMVGVGRGYSPDTGSGAELYTVIGHAPRHLDRNIALVGRIISGMEHLSSLPRGSGALGFYTEDEFGKRTPILSVRVANDLPEGERPAFEYLSTESETFARYADARANRRDPFFIVPAGGADICNIPVPVRRVGEAD